MKTNERIIEKINEITEEKENIIIVFKGIQTESFPKENKYFSFTIDYYDTLELDTIKNEILNNVIENREFSEKFKWMTIEEYQLFKEFENINSNPIVILENNLYDKQYPYNQTLSDIDNLYQYLYYQEDNELEPEQKKLLERVSRFYGKIDYSKQSNEYYVTYPSIGAEIERKSLYPFDHFEPEFTEVHNLSNIDQVELSEDEIPFLDLESEILAGTANENIVFVLPSSQEFLPHRYLERIDILSKIRNVKFYFTSLSIRRQIIENEPAYLTILKKVFGYDEFREIAFYKNIESQSKETINISQAQIIDDIVNQAEKAMFGEDFRDIYITASTGAGKSLMFQIPALHLAEKYKEDKPLTLVISPLIGLMNDQVDSMKRKGIRNSETINGNTPPYERERIIERIRNKEVDVLYLSPETLQARSDIKMLIDERSIGVVIIDEAHIVTTWGKSFRADYWYLGIYLAKLRKEYSFPIVTFTATAIYGGREDMYLDTRNSLNMISPISYFGYVRREDILMCVRDSQKALETEGRDYRKTKNALALEHLIHANKNNQKSLLYFPTIRLLMDFYNFIEQNKPDIAKKTGKYFGILSKEEKDEVLDEFKNGELQFVLATKAFGMGIDIPDITNVYHYAPTGNVVDYIQEVGRVARDKDKVEYGYAYIDFLTRDMNEVKQLYGMSSIRKSQIIDVMKKVLSTYKEKGNNRNLIMSPEDFKYIFVQNKRDEDSLDNKVKTVLLMIEKDFSSPSNLGYSPFVARPRSLFANDYIYATPALESLFMKSRLARFFEKVSSINSKNYSAIYRVNLGGIWESHYKSMSFPSFKYSLFTAEERVKLADKNIFNKLAFTSGIDVQFNDNYSAESILSEYQIIMKSFERFINQFRISGKYFTVNDLGNHFMKELKIKDRFESRAFAQTIINSAFEFGKIKETRFIAERSLTGSSIQSYIVHQDGDIFSSWILNQVKHSVSPKDNYIETDETVISYHLRQRNGPIDSKIAALGIGEAREILNYRVIGGHDPQIYLRMNSIYPLERAIKQGDFYKNSILTDVQVRHYTSVEMLKYLFTKEQPEQNTKERILNYTKWFWDQIEDYFMGILPERVKNELTRE